MGSSRATRPSAIVAALAFVLCGGAVATSVAFGGQEAQPSPLAIVEVAVTPTDPGPDTLCQLRVRLANRGDRPAYALGFEVRLGGEALPVYERQLYYQRLAPGETTEVRLFNFWTTETGRQRPADGRLAVEVVLREATWLEVSTEPEEGSGEPIEVWAPGGEVPGLPVSSSRVLELGG